MSVVDCPGVMDRFHREIRAVAKLRHPNIVTAFTAFRDGESLVFAMEYVEGLDLARMVSARGPMPVAHACQYIQQAAQGLEHAHESTVADRVATAPAPAPDRGATTAAGRDRRQPEEIWKSLINFDDPEDIPAGPAVEIQPVRNRRRWFGPVAGLAGFAAVLLCAGVIYRIATANKPREKNVESVRQIPAPSVTQIAATQSTETIAEKVEQKPAEPSVGPVVVQGESEPIDKGKAGPAQVAVQSAADPGVWKGWSKDDPPPAIAPFDAAGARAHQVAWAKHLGVPVEYENSVGMMFILIPPGEFLMGGGPLEIEDAMKAAGEDESLQARIASEAPQHQVILTRPIYLGIYDVTQKDYQSTMGNNPSYHARTGPVAKFAKKCAR